MSKIALIFKFRVVVFVMKFLIRDFNYILVNGISIQMYLLGVLSNKKDLHVNTFFIINVFGEKGI